MSVTLICPNCSIQLTVDEISIPTAMCPGCGSALSSATGSAAIQIDLQGDIQPSLATPPTQDETLHADQARGGMSAIQASQLPLQAGRYVIEAAIADGGFGRVYKARDIHLGRVVALKIPHPDRLKDPRKLQLFLSEAKLAAKLRHPGIVTIFDVGEFDNHLPYIAMEYVAGESLACLMIENRPSIMTSVDWMIQIAEAIHAAIQAGIVHRDLKPANILIDERGLPRVVDFGLAVAEDDQIQHRGEVAGTPNYMSPEQFRGETHRLDARTDIWSMGVILYELLTGRRPFRGELAQVREDVLTHSPKPPRQIDDSIPRALEAICLKCLAKSPDDRYLTARDFAEALSDWKQGAAKVQMNESRPTPPPANDRSGFRRILTVLLIASSLAMAAFALILPPSTRPQAAPAFCIDDRAVLHEWVPVLDAPPKTIAWEPSNPNSTWNHDPVLKRQTISSSATAVFAVGETRSPSFRLQATIGRSAWTGSVGLFFGGLAVASEQGHPGVRYECVTIETKTLRGQPVYQLQREICDIYPVQGLQYCSFQSRQLAAVKIEPLAAETTLEVHVTHGVLTAVIRNGTAIAELAPFPNPGIEIPQDQPKIFGITNDSGASTFRDVRVMLIEKPVRQ